MASSISRHHPASLWLWTILSGSLLLLSLVVKDLCSYSGTFSRISNLFIHCVHACVHAYKCVWVCACVFAQVSIKKAHLHTAKYLWRSEDTLWELVLPFYHGTWNWGGQALGGGELGTSTFTFWSILLAQECLFRTFVSSALCCLGNSLVLRLLPLCSSVLNRNKDISFSKFVLSCVTQ